MCVSIRLRDAEMWKSPRCTRIPPKRVQKCVSARSGLEVRAGDAQAAAALHASALQPNICLLLQEACTTSLDDALGRWLEIRPSPRDIVLYLSGCFTTIMSQS